MHDVVFNSCHILVEKSELVKFFESTELRCSDRRNVSVHLCVTRQPHRCMNEYILMSFVYPHVLISVCLITLHCIFSTE